MAALDVPLTRFGVRATNAVDDSGPAMLTEVAEVRSTEVMELTSVKAEVLSLRRRWRFDCHREMTEVAEGAIDRGWWCCR